MHLNLDGGYSTLSRIETECSEIHERMIRKRKIKLNNNMDYLSIGLIVLRNNKEGEWIAIGVEMK